MFCYDTLSNTQFKVYHRIKFRQLRNSENCFFNLFYEFNSNGNIPLLIQIIKNICEILVGQRLPSDLFTYYTFF